MFAGLALASTLEAAAAGEGSAAEIGASTFRTVSEYRGHMKRMRSSTMDYDQAESALIRNNQGGPDGAAYCQEVNIKRGKRKRPSVKRLLNKIRRSQVEVVSRYQSLTDNFQLSYGLSCKLSYYENGQNTQHLPVYAFNLSSIAHGAHNVSGVVKNCFNIPFYRLSKNSSNQYRWIYQLGNNNNPDGSTDGYRWYTEDQTMSSMNPAAAEYTLDWVNIRLMLAAATTVDSHIDIYEVNFLDKYGPKRRFFNWTDDTVHQEDPEPTGDDENDVTAWWDHYLAARTCHPFRTDMLRKNTIPKPWRILRHKTIKFGARPDSDTNTQYGPENVPFAGPIGYRKCVNIFNRYDYDINLRSQNPYTATAMSDRIINNENPQKPAYIPIEDNTQFSIFGPPEKDRWLVISAKNYCKAITDDSTGQPWLINPSFDIVVRQKVYYDVR